MKLTSRSSTFWKSLLEEWFRISVILERLLWTNTPATSLGGISSWHDESPIKDCNENCAQQSCSMCFQIKLTHTANPWSWQTLFLSQKPVHHWPFWKVNLLYALICAWPKYISQDLKNRFIRVVLFWCCIWMIALYWKFQLTNVSL